MTAVVHLAKGREILHRSGPPVDRPAAPSSKCVLPFTAGLKLNSADSREMRECMNSLEPLCYYSIARRWPVSSL
jgi:hypothetical protein